MQPWHFDDLTRTLGKATSRRQVLKGLLGGLAATAVARSGSRADGGCDVAQCKTDADALYQQEYQSCKQDGGKGAGFCTLVFLFQRQWHYHKCDQTGCFQGTCCGDHCADRSTDAQNCGACGHTCPANAQCIAGRCQCDDPLTNCHDICVDTDTDRTNCGRCGHTCGTCQDCQGGQCVPKQCDDGSVCCQDACVPLCPSGDPPDPVTCQCNVCQGQIDGAACDAQDASEVCCQEQCVSNQCPSGKTFDLDTCRCHCTSTCPDGQLQDPDTCQCQDLCAGKTCGECQTCDATSGDCIQADDQTPCGTNQVCCSGVCKDSCNPCAGQPDTTPCGSGKICCSEVCLSGETCNPCGSDPAYSKPCTDQYGTVCCPTDATCCAGNGNICGPDSQNANVCCEAGTYQCDHSCCDDPSYCTPVTHHPDWPAVCCASMATDSDGNCCAVGEVAEDCSDTPDGPVTSAVCCAIATIQNGGSCCS